MYKPLLAGIALAGIALAAPTAHADDWSKKYTVNGKPSLRVQTDDGNVEITTGAANEIDVHVSTTSYKIEIGFGGNLDLNFDRMIRDVEESPVRVRRLDD